MNETAAKTFEATYENVYALVSEREARMSEEMKRIVTDELHTLLTDLYYDEDTDVCECKLIQAKRAEHAIAMAVKSAVKATYSSMQAAVNSLI